MPNRYSMMKGLIEISEYMRAKADIAGVGKGKDVFDFWYRTAEDALALLREQEPVKPETVVRTGFREGPTLQALICGNCHKIMGYTVHYNFCPWCGRKVMWDGHV